LAPFSFFGCMVYVFGIVGVTYVYSFIDPDFNEWGQRTTKWVWSKAPLFMSTYTYAIEGIIGVLPNESSLKKPQQTNAFIAFSLFFYGINALIFALIAYLAGFGGPDTIIIGLPQKSTVILIVKVCLVFALVMTHPLGINYASEPIEQLLFPQPMKAVKTHQHPSETTPLVQTSINESSNADAIFWDEKSMQRIAVDKNASRATHMTPDVTAATERADSPTEFHGPTHAKNQTAVITPEQNAKPTFWQRRGRMIIRTSFILISCFVGWLIPNFSNFSNFVGSFFLSFIGFICPPAMYLKLLKDRRRWYHILPAGALIIYGFAFLVIGTYAAVQHVVNPKG